MSRQKRIESIEFARSLRSTVRLSPHLRRPLPTDSRLFPGRHTDAEQVADLKALRNKDNRRHGPKGQR